MNIVEKILFVNVFRSDMFGERAVAGGSDLHVSAERRLHVV